MSTEEKQGAAIFASKHFSLHIGYGSCDTVVLTVVKTFQCDGSNPCHRCNQADQVCTFTERKRPKGRIYPDGYVLPPRFLKIYIGFHVS